MFGVDAGAKLGDDDPVDGDLAGGDELLGATA